MIDQSRVEEAIEDITERIDVYVHDAGDFHSAYELQQRTLLYPMDALLLALAEDIDATLVTFDKELIDSDAREPQEFI